MKRLITLTIATAAAIGLAAPASAQLGGLGGALKKVQQAQEAKQKLDDLTFSEEEERQIGTDVSEQIRARFGVVQDPAIHKYVTLVGTLLAQQSERPKLAWTFIVLDTDGVNAFAAPGGFVHITRGALGLVDSEAELAGVLAHEIGHIVRKHTISALQKGNVTKLAAEAAASRAALLAEVANAAYSNIIENAFDRGDEMDADRLSVQLTQKSGYAAGTLGGFLTRLSDRNKDAQERNGLFASHPETKERIAAIGRLATPSSTTALAKARYDANVKYEPTPITSIAVVTEGSAGLTGSGAKEPAKKEEPKPRTGLGLTTLKPTTTQEKQSAQVSASGGARGLGADRSAKGGGNPRLVAVTVSASEIAAFQKGIS
jgi:predicted Zn-dependent protease